MAFGLGQALRKLTLRAQTDGVNKAKREVNGLDKAVGQMKRSWAAVGPVVGAASVLAATGIGLMGAATVKGGKSLIDTGRQVETFRIRLETVTKSADKANKLFAFLIDFGQKTPFELPGILEAAQRLETYSINTENAIGILGDAAAGNAKTIQEATLAATQGMLGEMEMLKQFAITSFDVQEKLGKQADRSTLKGQQEIFTAILQIMEERFTGGMDKMSRSWDGMTSNLLDNMFKVRKDLAEGGFFDTVKGDLKDVLAFSDRFVDEGLPQLTEGFNRGFSTIHEAFFAPLFDSLSTAGGGFETLGTRVELAMLQAATGIRNIVHDLLTFKQALEDATDVDKIASKEGLLSLLGVPAGFRSGIAKAKSQDFVGPILSTLDESEIAVVQRIAELKRILELESRGILDQSLFTFPREGISTAGATGLGREGLFSGGGEETQIAGTPKPGDPEFVGPLAQPTQATFQAKASEAAGGSVLAFGQAMEAMQEMHGEHITDWFETEGLKAEFARSQGDIIVDATNNMFSRLGDLQRVAVVKGANLGRVANAMLIRGAGEVAKAGIESLKAESTIRAKVETAKALSALAQFNFASAAQHGLAAAKFGAISGAGSIAIGLLENRIAQKENALAFNQLDPNQDTAAGAFGSSSGARSRRFLGTARSVRTGPQTNNFFLSLTNYVSGDYHAGDGEPTTLEQLQALIDQGALQVPA